MTHSDSVLDLIDDTVADWNGSRDSMRWRPDVLAEIEHKQTEHLAAVARLVAAHSDASVEDAFVAVRDVDEHGLHAQGWPLCVEAMRSALAPHLAPVLARGVAFETLVPSMISAFVQMAHHER